MDWATIAKVATDAGNTLFNQYSSSKAYRRSREAAQHAHQWEVGDLRAAGLNPILSATGGSGASAQAFQAAPADMDLSSAMSKDAQIALTKEQLKNVDADTRLKHSQTESNVWTAAEAARRMDKITEEIANLRSQRGLVQAQTAAQLGASLESLGRYGTLGSVVQMNRAHASQLHAAAFQARQSGLLSNQEYNYFQRHPEELPIKVLHLSGSNPLLYAKALQNVFGEGNSAKTSPGRPRVNVDPHRFDNWSY